MKKQVASISGGRTSHFMISELVKKFGKDNVDLVCCDTGAEHEGTYQFIRDTEKYFNMKITCLRLVMPKEDGVGGQYEILSSSEIKKDYKAFKSLTEKYGLPFNPGGKFCTDQMKTQIYKKYCNSKYGKGNYTTWIGYRHEPKDASRSWGHTVSGQLNKWFNVPQRDQGEFYKDCVKCLDSSLGDLVNHILSQSHLPITDEGHYGRVMKVVDRVVKTRQKGYRFLFEISDFDKTDIIDWWEGQEFDLNIPPNCGNCVFCIEKTVNQLSYLCHTQPEYAKEWVEVVTSPLIPVKGRKMDEDVMYRDGSRKISFIELHDEAMKQPLEYWESKMYREKRLSPCAAGSCDLFDGDY